jgi:hypothetical protein
MILLLIVFTPGLILSKIIMSTGLCFRIGLRIEKTINAMIAEKMESVSNTSAMINVVISTAPIDLVNAKLNPKRSSMIYQLRLKYCIWRSCFWASSNESKVPRFLRLCVLGFFFLE